jgi:hypothetical protein
MKQSNDNAMTQDGSQPPKKTYKTPTLTNYGTVEQQTQIGLISDAHACS